MKKTIKKFLSLTIAVAIVIGVMSTATVASASETDSVRVIVRNDVYSVEDGAAWDGVLIDEWVDIDENSSMMSAVVDALDNHGYTQKGAENSYIEEINGLAAFDSTPSSGWTGTINDWFTNEAYSEFTVASGKLEDGDEICIMYTNTYGEDVGSLWDNNETTLKDLSFSNGTLSSDFEPSITEYTLTLDSNTTSVMVTPTATNKNYQVRTYKNEYTPDVEDTEYKRNELIEVADGDKIIIGVGDSNWPSMNQTDGGTVYTINVKIESDVLLGDVNHDNYIDVKDATSIQKFLVGLEIFTDEQIANADYNKDGFVSVLDATAIQKYIVGIE